MQPLAMLLGVVMGSAVSITVALVLTVVVFLWLPEYADRIGQEFPPLLRALGGSAVLALLSAAAFYGELRRLGWRRIAQFAMSVWLVGLLWWVWPE